MSARIVSESSSRVVDRPRRRADSTSAALADGDRPEHPVVCEQRCETTEEVADLLVSTPCEAREAVARCRDGDVDDRVLCCGDMEEVAGVLHDDQAIPGYEAFRQVGADIRHPVAAEHDRLSRSEVFEAVHHSNPSSSGSSFIITGRPVSIERCAANPMAADRSPSISVTAGAAPERIAAAKSTCSR